jgi:uncharacterized protein YciI
MTDAKHDVARADERHAGAQKLYFVCFTDPVQLSPDEIRPHLEPHKAWVMEMERSRRLFAAGPLLDENYRFAGPGMMVLRATSFADAEEVVNSDPFHANGIRSYRLVPWQINEGTMDLQLTLSSGTFEIS